MEPNKRELLAHLSVLFGWCVEDYPEGAIQIQSLPGRAPGLEHRYFPVAEIKDAARWAYERNQAGHNVYVGVNPRDRHSGLRPEQNATDEHIKIARWQFADLDSEESLERLATAPIAASFEVITGTVPHQRVHLYYRLEEPCRNLQAWRSVQVGLAEHYLGDRVIDPRRIMRLAGTVSYPDEKKQARGYVQELVRYIEHDTQDYGGAQLAQIFPVSAPKAAPGALNIGGAENSGLEVGSLIQKIGPGNWHYTVRDLVAHWINRGYPDDIILLICRNFTLSGYTEEQTDREVRTLLKSARAKWDIPNPSEAVEAPAESALAAIEPLTIESLNATFLPPRRWVLGSMLLAGNVSVLVAPPGIGKSSLSILQALSVATGRALIGAEPFEQGATWIYNNEDDTDELRRRVLACCQFYGISLDEIRGKFFFCSGADRRLSIATVDKQETVHATKDYSAIMEFIDKHNVKMFSVDPFLETHSANENNNAQMKDVAALYRSIAQKTKCAVQLIHHSSKPPQGDSVGHVGNLYSARGASSIIGVARIMQTLYGMSSKDAEGYGIKLEDRHRYVRLDDAKSNMSLISADATWFYRESVQISNGDWVGVLSLRSLESAPTPKKKYKYNVYGDEDA